MIEQIATNLVTLKQKFAQIYEGNGHIQEVIPSSPSKDFPINDNHLELLHNFAEKNPIYYNSYEQTIAGVPCNVYEGDINEYWLNSIKHGSSCQPFYPTWIVSAYVTTSIAKTFGYTELIDIGSGDGRIAYCAKILGLQTTGIEIDDALVELQKIISLNTMIDFNPICTDAIEFDYSVLDMTRPIFFIGGLPQMGGDILATSIVEKISNIPNLKKNTCIVFAGTHSKRQFSDIQTDGGWSSLINKHGLKVIKTVFLPTIWTFDQLVDTPYIYAEFI